MKLGRRIPPAADESPLSPEAFEARPKRSRKPGPLRVVAVTRVLDEADIIEPFIRHTAAYVCGHLLIDNDSCDGTMDIIQSLAAEGFPLIIYRNSSVSYVEQDSNGFLFEYAVTNMDADWVLFLDADEFVDDRALTGGLLTLLARLGEDKEDKPCIMVPVFNYIVTTVDEPDEVVASRRMQYRLDKSYSSHVVLRADQLGRHAKIEAGAHFVSVDGHRLEPHIEPGLAIAHYSERNAFQMLAKSIRGWSKVLAAGEALVTSGTSFHYRGPFEALRNKPEDLLKNSHYMNNARHPADLIHDPISYLGGTLRFTENVDYPMSSVRGLIGFVERLSKRFGRILEEVPDARAFNAALDAQYAPIISDASHLAEEVSDQR